MLLIAVCLFATVYSALGMRTVYYQDGRVCDVCTDTHDGVVPYKQSYTPEEAGKRVIYSGSQDRINSRPIISPSSSSSSYIVDRGDYSSRNFSLSISYLFVYFCLLSLLFVYVARTHLFVLLDVIRKICHHSISTFQTKQNNHIWTNRITKSQCKVSVSLSSNICSNVSHMKSVLHRSHKSHTTSTHTQTHKHTCQISHPHRVSKRSCTSNEIGV